MGVCRYSILVASITTKVPRKGRCALRLVVFLANYLYPLLHPQSASQFLIKTLSDSRPVLLLHLTVTLLLTRTHAYYHLIKHVCGTSKSTSS